MRLNEIFETYKDRVAFFFIYINEAHPSDGWQTPQNLYDDVVYATPTTDDQRAEIAGACVLAQDIRLPTLLDGIDDPTEQAYIAEPIRLYVIDGDGAIAYNGAQGPFGFDLDQWEQEIRQVLGEASQAAE